MQVQGVSHAGAANVSAVSFANSQRPLAEDRANAASLQKIPETDAVDGRTSQKSNASPQAEKQQVTDKKQSEQEQESAQAKDDKQQQKSEDKIQGQLDERQLLLVKQLSERDREVRVHEQAHASVGGGLAGSPSYDFKRGPDGVQYAVSGEVSIDVAPVNGDPEKTLEKMRTVKSAALAPAEPSSQDRQVAAKATQQESSARAELLINERMAAKETKEEQKALADEQKAAKEERLAGSVEETEKTDKPAQQEFSPPQLSYSGVEAKSVISGIEKASAEYF